MNKEDDCILALANIVMKLVTPDGWHSDVEAHIVITKVYMGLDHPEDAHKQAQRALEAAADHGYPADRIQEIQTLLQQTASS